MTRPLALGETMKLIRVAPIGDRPIAGLVTRESGCGIEWWREPVYPPHPRGAQLRDARMEPYRSLRDAARLTGLTAENISGLENGRYALGDDDWTRLLALLAAPPPSLFAAQAASRGA